MKKLLISALAVFAFGFLCGWFLSKLKYDKPIEENVTTDTVVVYRTLPDYNPSAKDSTLVRWKTKYLPVYKTDTFDNPVVITEWMHDTVAVQVPITSKHYGSKDYDAWVSGFEPNLDSIKVYQKTERITTTITKTVKDNRHFFLDVAGGTEYAINDKRFAPFAELGVKFRKDRFGIGVSGGYQHNINDNKGEPYLRGKVSYDIVSF